MDAQSDTHLWSETFERELDDIFAIQREIAEAIVDQLQITLSVGQQTRLVAEATEPLTKRNIIIKANTVISLLWC